MGNLGKKINLPIPVLDSEDSMSDQLRATGHLFIVPLMDVLNSNIGKTGSYLSFLLNARDDLCLLLMSTINVCPCGFITHNAF